MILQALHEYAKREGLVADPDFELKPIAFMIEVSTDGSRFTIRPTFTTPTAKPGKKPPRPVATTFAVPREPSRTSGARAFFLYDKAEYVFGLDPDGKRTAAKLAQRAELFRQRVAACAATTGDPAVGAILCLLEDLAAGRQQVELPEDCASNSLFQFFWHDDIDLPVIERPAVKDYWRQLRQQSSADSEVCRCLVSGELARPAKRHGMLRYVPGASTSGVPFVSFNSSAFESYGWKGNENAPISQGVADSYVAALRRLLHPAPPNPKNPSNNLAPQNYRLSGDTVVAFWTHNPAGDVILGLLDAQPEEVGAVYRSVWQGKAPQLDGPEDFFALTLTGAQGRPITRGWFRSTVSEVLHHLATHFGDLDLVRLTPPPKKGGHPPAYPLRQVLRALAPLGKSDQVPAALGQQIFQAALGGTPYPFSALQRAVLRERAEISRDGWTDLDRRDARRALIKAILERRRRLGKNLQTYPELKKKMDPQNTSPGYLLGRLMAVIERLQQEALGDVNASVVDRFFGSASATPAAVFPRLLKNARHHARKAKDTSRKGFTIHLERLLDQIADRFDPADGFPSALDLESQGLFMLGYHQQRKDFFTKKETTTDSATADA